MKISDLLRLSFENLRRRMGRTSLTIIGVVVGTCSIVVMMSLGIAMDKNFSEQLEQWADLTVIQVYNWSYVENGQTPIMDDAQVAAIAEMPHVSVATPQYSPQYISGGITVQTENGRYKIDGTEITAMYADAIKALDIQLVDGNYLQTSNRANTVSVLFGQNIAWQFTDSKRSGDGAYRWPGQTDASGNEVKPFVDINKDNMVLVLQKAEDDGQTMTYKVNICGTMLEDYKKGYYTSYGILMDLESVQKLEKEYMRANGIRANKKTNYQSVYVKVDSIDNVVDVDQAIKDLGFETYSMSSERENMQKQSQMIQMVLGGIGAISLFVAALSIANTMTMSIYERTREIGVMKVLGCDVQKIRLMFLLEAGMIGLIGGIIGIAFSYLLSFVLNHFAPMLSGIFSSMFGMYGGGSISIIPLWLSLLGLSFATVIGVVSGIMPASRAVKISALEAIRHE